MFTSQTQTKGRLHLALLLLSGIIILAVFIIAFGGPALLQTPTFLKNGLGLLQHYKGGSA